ncbi:MAG: T9SS type A sorting domain-containing protein [Flavobacteriales bacterium]
MKKNLLSFAVFLFCSCAMFGQISHGGQPHAWKQKELASEIPFVQMGAIDLDRLLLEDEITDQYKDLPYRFGYEFATNISMENSGRKFRAQDGSNREIWQVGIECPGALSMSLRFDAFRIPKGGEVYLWTADRKAFLGSFNHLNNRADRVLPCGLLHGDRLIVEYILPEGEDKGELMIGEVVHAYRSFATSPFVQEALRGPFGNSGACEVNVNCPEGADWQVEKRSVAIITQGGSGLCTGALVNNTANDGTPYFLTANHCIQGSNTANWVFYFNHETSGCTGSTGPTTDLISGAQVVANRAGSDFALLLLNDTPPASYDVQYAGWDATDNESSVSSAVCIHHPSGDVKKISFENDAPYFSVDAGAQTWFIDNWELAVTEPGSSGSPLFNQDHRIIGQLFGGASACSGSQGNGQYDYYGRFGVSWNTGASASTRLIDWLDPAGTGVLVLDGYPEGAISYDFDAGSSSIAGVPASICGSTIQPSFTLVNHGVQTLNTCVIHYSINGVEQTQNWSGSLAQNQTATINLPTLTASNGSNTLLIWVTNPNGNADQNAGNDQTSVTFNAITGTTVNSSISITFDNFPEETSWEITNSQGNVLIYGGTYANQADGSTLNLDVCLALGCYTFTITDEYGDGICCQYGNGSYTVTNQFDQVVATGGSFADSESTSFCLTATSVEELGWTDVRMFPNPTDASVQLTSDNTILGISMMDMTGRVVYTHGMPSTQFTIDTAHLSEGVYIIQSKTTAGTSAQRLVVRH